MNLPENTSAKLRRVNPSLSSVLFSLSSAFSISFLDSSLSAETNSTNYYRPKRKIAASFAQIVPASSISNSPTPFYTPIPILAARRLPLSCCERHLCCTFSKSYRNRPSADKRSIRLTRFRQLDPYSINETARARTSSGVTSTNDVPSCPALPVRPIL